MHMHTSMGLGMDAIETLAMPVDVMEQLADAQPETLPMYSPGSPQKLKKRQELQGDDILRQKTLKLDGTPLEEEDEMIGETTSPSKPETSVEVPVEPTSDKVDKDDSPKSCGAAMPETGEGLKVPTSAAPPDGAAEPDAAAPAGSDEAGWHQFEQPATCTS